MGSDLGSAAVTDAKCGGCDQEKATSMVQMFGQPYHLNTLKSVPPSETASMNRNFLSVLNVLVWLNCTISFIIRNKVCSTFARMWWKPGKRIPRVWTLRAC